MGRSRGGHTSKIHVVIDRSGRSGSRSRPIRTLVRQHGAWANIPPKSNRKEALTFSPYLYRARNLVERFFNKIKHCRRVATRYDKLAANYLAFIQLASIRLWLRIDESTTYYSGSGDWPGWRDL
jgi:transposase